MGIFTIAFFCMLIYIVLLLTEKPPISYANIPFPVIGKTTYKPWETVYFAIQRCVTRDITYSFTANLVDLSRGTEYAQQSSNVSATAWCEGILSVPTVVPDLPSGAYKKTFKIIAEWRFRNFVIPIETQKFYIASNKDIEDFFVK